MTAADVPAETLRVELARSGMVLELHYGDSILDAIEEAGVDVEWTCRAGICGSCHLRVLKGTPLHRDSCLTQEERSSSRVIAPCVSWSSSETLVLDV